MVNGEINPRDSKSPFFLPEKEELKIASGQASEELNRRFMALQQRTSGLERQLAPVVQNFIQDLEKFERDLVEHIAIAEPVLQKASSISVSSNEAYQKTKATYDASELETEIIRVEKDIREAHRAMPRTLKKLKQRMEKSLGPLQDKDMAKKEVLKMGHMLGAIRLAALETIKKIRSLAGSGHLEEANEIFWNTWQTEAERYLATVRDLQKEEMQQARAGGMGNDMVENIQMPGMKLQGGNLLGSKGATDLSGVSAGGGSFSDKGRMSGGAGGGGSGGGVPPPASPSGGGNAGGGGLTSLNALPKLEL